MTFSALSCSFSTRLDSHLFRILIPPALSPCSRVSRCGRPLDSRGHRRLVREQGSWVGVAVPCSPLQHGSGTRVTTNIMMRDFNLRRLEVLEGGLPLFWGTQLAIDTTLVSTLHTAIGPPAEEGRGGYGRCKATHSKNTPSVLWTVLLGTAGRCRRGGRWQVVTSGPCFPVPLNKSQEWWRTTTFDGARYSDAPHLAHSWRLSWIF